MKIKLLTYKKRTPYCCHRAGLPPRLRWWAWGRSWISTLDIDQGKIFRQFTTLESRVDMTRCVSDCASLAAKIECHLEQCWKFEFENGSLFCYHNKRTLSDFTNKFLATVFHRNNSLSLCLYVVDWCKWALSLLIKG